MRDDSFDMDRLGEWLESHVEGFRVPFDIAKLSGGQSNPTYRIATSERNYVLRRRPFGLLLPTAHAVDREFVLTSALHPAGFPVARPLAICEDADLIGEIFYVMEHVHGRNWTDGALPNLAPTQRREIYLSMVDALAALHRLDPTNLGLADFGRAGDFIERQVYRWTRQYRASETETIPEMDQLIDWLPRTRPAQTASVIVHGDFRIDNLIYATDSSQIRAVIDWELSTLGDPLIDFSYFALNWSLPANGAAALGGLDLSALGIPSLAEAIDRYASRAGIDVPAALDWYFAFNAFRLAAIVQGVKKRFLEGNASSDTAPTLVRDIQRFAALGCRFAKGSIDWH